MPIRPELRDYYGPAWRRLSRRLRERARYTCERCGRQDGEVLVRGEVFREPDDLFWRRRSDGLPVEPPAELFEGEVRTVRIVVAVAHRDGRSGHDTPENLMVLCQPCHLAHDKEQHRRNKIRTWRRKRIETELASGQLWLFEGRLRELQEELP